MITAHAEKLSHGALSSHAEPQHLWGKPAHYSLTYAPGLAEIISLLIKFASSRRLESPEVNAAGSGCRHGSSASNQDIDWYRISFWLGC